jgi:hypothetical protein
MANRPDLHKFRDDLKEKPGRGQVKPPRVISATNLDENFAKVTVIDSDAIPPLYRVKYTKAGAILTDFLAGSTTSEQQPRPFELRLVDVGGSAAPQWKVRVYPSTIAGGTSAELGFQLADNPPFLLDVRNGILQGKITINEMGEVTGRDLELVQSLGADTTTQFHIEIGTVQGVAVSNSCYGPIGATICRDWFSNPPTYSVTFSPQ